MTVITSRHLSLGLRERGLVDEASDCLCKHFRRIVRIDWSFGMEPRLAVVSCSVLSRTGRCRATARAALAEDSIHLVLQKLLKQARRRKGRMLSRRHKEDRAGIVCRGRERSRGWRARTTTRIC